MLNKIYASPAESSNRKRNITHNRYDTCFYDWGLYTKERKKNERKNEWMNERKKEERMKQERKERRKE